MVTTLIFERGTHRLKSTHASFAEASKALPEGAYTTLRTYAGRRVLRLARHVERLNESLRLTGRAGNLSVGDARAAIAAALAETRYSDSRLRLTYVPPRLFVSVEAFEPTPSVLYERGVACVTLEVHRETPHAKDTRFIATAASAYARLPAGVHEGLLVSAAGEILEGLSSNFFAIVDGTLRTERERALLGVTRSLVLEVARGLLPIAERAATRDELPRISEAFITSVSRGILPVVAIDGVSLGSGAPGDATRELMRRLAALEAGESESLP
jgi:branched-chain amino acid aminotransferase